MNSMSYKLNRSAVCGGLILMFLSACLPIWQNWHFSSWEGVGALTNLWSAGATMAKGDTEIGFFPWLFEWHGANWVIALLVFVFGFACTWGMGKLLGPCPSSPPKNHGFAEPGAAADHGNGD